MKKKLRYYAIGIIALLASTIYTFDNVHFYRASYLFSEPRLQRKLLTSFDITISGGSTDKSRNPNHDIVPLLDIFGLHSMHELGVNVPNKNLTDPRDITLTQLALTPARNNFATFSINGTFSIFEANFSYIQNTYQGIFVQAYLPVRKLQIKNIVFNDLSPTNIIFSNKNTPIWQAFLRQFDSILQKYELSREAIDRTGVGDLTLFVGWTHNYQETKIIDFIDASLRLGLLFPTGKTRDEDKVFSLPLGYNGHWGIPFVTDLSFGLYDWLTFGAHLQTMFFADRTRNIRMKTGPQQSGLIKLAKGLVEIDKGTIWNAGGYIKADHFVYGLSITLGYSFASQNRDQLCPCKPDIFNPSIVNTDEMLKGWKMHTINLFIEYDFTKENSKLGPRIGLLYNAQVGGKRTFKTNIFGGNFGLDIAWDI